MRSPKGSSFYGLGWMRIPTYILVKKLLFAVSILRLKDDNVVRKVFIARIDRVVARGRDWHENEYNSPTINILCAAKRLGLLNVTLSFASGDTIIPGKKAWSDLVWSRAWQLEDVFWNSVKFLYRENDLLVSVLINTMYLPWWSMSDKEPNMMCICENMVKLICHASRLRCDDIRLKGQSHSHLACSECDMFTLDDAAPSNAVPRK